MHPETEAGSSLLGLEAVDRGAAGGGWGYGLSPASSASSKPTDYIHGLFCTWVPRVQSVSHAGLNRSFRSGCWLCHLFVFFKKKFGVFYKSNTFSIFVLSHPLAVKERRLGCGVSSVPAPLCHAAETALRSASGRTCIQPRPLCLPGTNPLFKENKNEL